MLVTGRGELSIAYVCRMLYILCISRDFMNNVRCLFEVHANPHAILRLKTKD